MRPIVPRLLALLIALVAVSALAQTTANLTGTVSLDGKPSPGISVTVSSPNLLGTRTVTTDSNGNYNIAALPPGDYTVKFELEGMQPMTRNVKVGLAQTARADGNLTVATAKVTDVITVTASSPAVLEATEVQSNIPQKLVEDLPMGRTLLAIVDLAPGTSTNGPAGATVISGAPSFDNLFLVDGATVNENLRGQPHDLFIEDAIQETTILTGAISAEFGRFTGGVVTAISKSGGNEYSGSLRDSVRNPSWTAQSGAGEARPSSKLLHTYEATMGGRVIRDRLWFFAAGRYFDRNTDAFFYNSTLPYTQGRKQTREELKLTGQLTPRHSLQVAGFNITDKQTNNAFPDNTSVFEPSALDASRSTPNSFATVHYNGVLTNSLLLEANGARKSFAFVGSGGSAIGDLVNGTNVVDATQSPNPFLGAPTFCGGCANESRNNRNWNVKGTYYLSTPSFGTHSIVTGYDDWHQSTRADNHQSASDFTVFLYQGGGVTRGADGNARINLNPGRAIFVFWPILVSSRGNDLSTRSAFVNDKWDYNSHLSFNVGARYDKNVGHDGAAQLIADDSKLSPRLGAIYDVHGDGRLRVNASYSDYVAAIADGNVSEAASPAGSPSYLYWLYRGPQIRNATTTEALKTMFDWFNSVGGVKNKDFLLGGKTNGLGSIIPNPLGSPHVNEYTLGVGSQIGTHGFLRADYIHRNWKNFYTSVTNLGTGKVFDPLADADVDVSEVITTNDFVRRYNALELQGAYNAFTRLHLGGNYTYSKLRGNHGAETAGSGPVPNLGPGDHPEYLGYANRLPVGYLSADQRHKARLWVSYDQPTRVGQLNFSVLQSIDSGSAYSVAGTIDPTWYRDPKTNTIVERPNPGYVAPPTSSTYFFSARGQFHTPTVTSTNLAVNYNLPRFAGVQIFVETELRNIFNEQKAVTVNTSVLTAKNDDSLQPFDPFKDTPVLGTNYTLGPNFGKPVRATSFDSAGDFQLPRTFLVSVGAKF